MYEAELLPELKSWNFQDITMNYLEHYIPSACLEIGKHTTDSAVKLKHLTTHTEVLSLLGLSNVPGWFAPSFGRQWSPWMGNYGRTSRKTPLRGWEEECRGYIAKRGRSNIWGAFQFGSILFNNIITYKAIFSFRAYAVHKRLITRNHSQLLEIICRDSISLC